MKLSSLVTLCVVTFTLICFPAHSEERQLEPLSAEDIAKAVTLERQALPQLRLPLSARIRNSVLSGRPKLLRNVIPTPELLEGDPAVSLIGAPGLIPAGASRRALVTRFDYETGLTAETTIDLDGGTVLDVTVRQGRLPSLTLAELNYAIDLAIAQNREFAANVSVVGRERTEFSAMVIGDSRTSSQTFGHRLILLEVDSVLPRLLVDLSTHITRPHE